VRAEDDQAMGTQRRPRSSTALTLVAAVAIAALAGYLISRPQGPNGDTAPVSSPGPHVDGPFSTDGYSVADDSETHQVVVFGGDLSLNQTWLWNGKRWSLAHPPKSPPGREEAATAYDPELHMVLLFGGIRPVQSYLDDTWGWNGSTWRELNAGTNAPPPGPASMAWDPAVHAIVLMPASSSGADTWTWAGAGWIDHRQADPYLPTGVLTLAFDPVTSSMVAVGFGNVISPEVGAVTQTWTWDGTAWTQLVTARAPTAYVILGLGWDPITSSLLLFAEGPTTPLPLLRWEWTGTDWTALPPMTGPSIIEGLLTGVDTGSLLLVGEMSAAPGAAIPLRVWSWTGKAWGVTSGRV
jgi:hypothetical protein